MSATGSQGPPQTSRSLQIALAVVVGLAALYALWAFVVSPLLGPDEPDVATDQVGGASTGPAAVPAEDPVVDVPPMGLLGEPVPETFEIFNARDPFQQLVVIAGTGTVAEVDQAQPTAQPTVAATTTPSAAAGAGSSGTTSTSPSSTPTAPSSSGGTITTGPETDQVGDADGVTNQDAGTAGEVYQPQPQQQATTTVSVQAVTLVPDEVLTVAIDEVAYDVGEGEVFADRFQLLDIDGPCAIMLFGDSRFTLCEGETITK